VEESRRNVSHGAPRQVRRDAMLHPRSRRLHHRSRPKQIRLQVRVEVANGKVVVITGASHGIGASLVSAYSEAGYNVIANALSIEPSSNPSIINVPGDIGKPETADRIMCMPSICRSAWQSSRSNS
jgi:hypothetical protein